MALEESIKMVGAISFDVFSPTEVRKYSTVEVTVPETYDEDGMPVQGGLMDSRLGVLEPGQKCGTCGNTSARCPGHFGHIELAEPVLHVAFVDIIHELLIATCRTCGRILIPEDEIKVYKEKLAEQGLTNPNLLEKISKEIIAKAKKAKVCPHCGKKKLEVEFTKPHMFHEINEEGGAVRLLPAAIRERLERITDDDLRLLGYDPTSARPEWLVLQVLPVPPVSVRPSITLETGIRSEDDLTHKLVDILRVNQRVRESKDSGTPPLIVQDLVDLLQYHVTTYFDNEVSGIPQAHHRSGRPLKTLSQRLKGKEGRFRGSLSGKRVDFSSRTVISPDPSLDISEVGVPYDVARKLTVPERVTPWNIDFLKKLVINGPLNHPGANYVIRPDGVKIRLEFASDRQTISEALAPNYVVERHLVDGDIVLFNRQPSLHRMSIMAHYVKVLPYRTFRLHPAVCPPYNADFDGDEMNLHVPQSEEARSEALTLMRVQDQIISPRYGGPIIGGIRDFLTAAFLLTKGDTKLTKEQFANLAYAGGYSGPLPEPEERSFYSGRQLFSLFLPKDFNYRLTSKWSKAKGVKSDKDDVLVKAGELVSGVVDKASIGAEEPETLLHRLAKDYGTDVARNFLNSILRILRAFISSVGFSYGYDELELSSEAREEIQQAIEKAYLNVNELFSKYEEGKLEVMKGLMPEQVLEQKIMTELSHAREAAGRIVERSLPDTNAGIVMAKTGARGSSLNLGQMMATVGQQSVRGKRISRGYYHRALPHFRAKEKNPDAYGFVKSNYRDGLNPIEFFFHAMGGREGLVDTAVRTQQSGYMQRRLVNAMEHLRVEYDLTVRDPQGAIVQFLYGEDGVDPSKSDHGKAVNIERLAASAIILDDPKAPKVTDKEVDALIQEFAPRLNDRLASELEVLKTMGLSKKAARLVCEKAVELYRNAFVEPGEAMGVVAAQSIGEPGTQMSIASWESVIVKEGNLVHTIKIGEFVDELMQRFPVTRESDTEWCDIPPEVGIEVPSLNPEGKVEWKRLKAVSRHEYRRPLIRVMTQSGRVIDATDNHSFVTRMNGKLIPVLGSDLKVGDRIPVVKHLQVPNRSLSLNDLVFKISTMQKSEQINADIIQAASDNLYQILYQDGSEQLHGKVAEDQEFLSVEATQMVAGNLESKLGRLIGLYLSGSTSDMHSSLLETAVQLKAVLDKKGVELSRDYIIFSLQRVIGELCGSEPDSKHLPYFALSASDEFVRMLLRAYFDSKGVVELDSKAIYINATSEELADGIALLLARFGIFTNKIRHDDRLTVLISAHFANAFLHEVGSDSEERKLQIERLSKLYSDTDAIDVAYGLDSIVSSILKKLGVSSYGEIGFTYSQGVEKAVLSRYIEIFDQRAKEMSVDIRQEIETLRSFLAEDVVWDEIVAIERLQSRKEKVYDFSVPGLETFVTSEGIVTHNTLRTFHFAGVKERDVTLGLPRLIELVDARKQPSTPTMDIYLDEEHRQSRTAALEVAKEILFTKTYDLIQQVKRDYATGSLVFIFDKDKMDERGTTVSDVASVLRTPKERITVDEKNLTMSIALESMDESVVSSTREKILNTRVKGVPGITSVSVVMANGEWMIQTAGSNLQKVLKIPGIDPTRTTTNNIYEINMALGVEAARTALVKEITSTLEEQGLEVDIRHILLVADLMTSKGFVQQIGRHGIAGSKTSVLARAAFEITVPTLAEAAATGEVEELKGVTENVIVGSTIPVGTGMVEIFMRGGE
ncbi:MAG: DNA-directed RNA polymerase subunit A' [Conexivisphaerales archaeon]